MNELEYDLQLQQQNSGNSLQSNEDAEDRSPSRHSTNDSNDLDIQFDDQMISPTLERINLNSQELDSSHRYNKNQLSFKQMCKQKLANFNGFLTIFLAKTVYYSLIFIHHLFIRLFCCFQLLLLFFLLFLYFLDKITQLQTLFLFCIISSFSLILRYLLRLSFPNYNTFIQLQQDLGIDQRQTFNRLNRPQSPQQRRIGQSFESEYQQRRQQEENNSQTELQEIQNQQDEENQPEPQPMSLQELSEQISNNEQIRRNRDQLRVQIMRILNERVNQEREYRRLNQRLHQSNLLRALQYLQTHRDFNSEDYEFLSSLDHSNYDTNYNNQKVQLLITQLPTYQFAQENQDELTDDGENFVKDQVIKILPCFHQFHSDCIDDWLFRKSQCPVCKFDIEKADEHLSKIYQQ